MHWRNLLSHYGELVSASPKSRPDPAKFITQCRAKGQYLANSFVDSNLFLAEIQVRVLYRRVLVGSFYSLQPPVTNRTIFVTFFCKNSKMKSWNFMQKFKTHTFCNSISKPYCFWKWWHSPFSELHFLLDKDPRRTERIFQILEFSTRFVSATLL